MGGFGHGHVHSDAVQLVTFVASLFFPGGVFALLAGAAFEQLKRRRSKATSQISAQRLATPLSTRNLPEAA